jgi:hypothetical protein
MHVRFYLHTEPHWRAWAWKILVGPAALLDGLCETLTLGFVGVGAKLAATRRLAQSRACHGHALKH